MQLVDRIEKRRFVGREFLLWLWFESEVFEGTLHTASHGSFGLWIERQLALTAGQEGTRIKGGQPGAGREAKESLRRGKLPESAGFHLVSGTEESTFTLKAEQLGISGLKLPAKLGAEEPDTPVLAPPARRPRRRNEDVDRQQARESDEAHEAFYERMHLTRDVEARIEALYRHFLELRLGDAWDDVAEMIGTWAAGESVDADAYRAIRDGASVARKGKRARTRSAG